MMINKSNATFLPESYSLNLIGRRGELVIVGQKFPPPSKRITLHQDGLKVLSAKITRQNKNIVEEYEVIRINHLNARREVRLHTKSTMFPGKYTLHLEFTSKNTSMNVYKQLEGKASDKSIKHLLPCIDTVESRAESEFKVSYFGEQN